jgi:hypothetical protein
MFLRNAGIHLHFHDVKDCVSAKELLEYTIPEIFNLYEVIIVETEVDSSAKNKSEVKSTTLQCWIYGMRYSRTVNDKPGEIRGLF